MTFHLRALHVALVLSTMLAPSAFLFPESLAAEGDGQPASATDSPADVIASTVSATNGKIVFAFGDLFVINPDGSGRINLGDGNDNAADWSPAWSPDGSKIAFATIGNRFQGVEIHVMNADGSERKKIIGGNGWNDFPSWSPDGKKIAFSSDRDDRFKNYEIYVANSDGSGITRLTHTSGYDQDPAFSPDGTKIAFFSSRTGGGQIWLMNADGSGQFQLTERGGQAPDWSPDGTKILFTSARDSGTYYDIYVMNADGTSEINLTNSRDYNDGQAVWSPDGTKILFNSIGPIDDDLYLINPDGSDQTQLTKTLSGEYQADWQPIPIPPPPRDSDNDGILDDVDSCPSHPEIFNGFQDADGCPDVLPPSRPTTDSDRDGIPNVVDVCPFDAEIFNDWEDTDGCPDVLPPVRTESGRIAFVSDRDGNNNVFVMNVDGNAVTRLTGHGASESFPSISPDGVDVLFDSDREGSAEIYIMRATNGGEKLRLTHNDVSDSDATWSPSGQFVAFVSARNGNDEIYIMDLEGQGETNLSMNENSDRSPAWSPDSNKIAFVSDRDGNNEIYVVDLESGDVVNLSNNPADDGNPSWSPDGDFIAFHSDRDNDYSIFVMAADGSQATRLTSQDSQESAPSWAPHSDRIAFVGFDGDYEIYVMNSDGTQQMKLTDNEFADLNPHFGISPPPVPVDTDGDGILDKLDECILDPEIFNGLNDNDGCPDVLRPQRNQVPIAVDDFFETQSEIPFSASILGNDFDPDGHDITIVSISDPPNGSVTDLGNGIIGYTPDLDFIGTDTFEYTIADEIGSRDTGTVTVKVAPNYLLELIEGDIKSDGKVNIGQEITGSAFTDNPNVDRVIFVWYNPAGDVVERAGSTGNSTFNGKIFENSFVPDEPGQWRLEADFARTRIIVQVIDVSFFVLPESSIGSIALVAASMSAMGLYVAMRNRTLRSP